MKRNHRVLCLKNAFVWGVLFYTVAMFGVKKNGPEALLYYVDLYTNRTSLRSDQTKELIKLLETEKMGVDTFLDLVSQKKEDTIKKNIVSDLGVSSIWEDITYAETAIIKDSQDVGLEYIFTDEGTSSFVRYLQNATSTNQIPKVPVTITVSKEEGRVGGDASYDIEGRWMYLGDAFLYLIQNNKGNRIKVGDLSSLSPDQQRGLAKICMYKIAAQSPLKMKLLAESVAFCKHISIEQAEELPLVREYKQLLEANAIRKSIQAKESSSNVKNLYDKLMIEFRKKQNDGMADYFEKNKNEVERLTRLLSEWQKREKRV